jgi:hypothetical protein
LIERQSQNRTMKQPGMARGETFAALANFVGVFSTASAVVIRSPTRQRAREINGVLPQFNRRSRQVDVSTFASRELRQIKALTAELHFDSETGSGWMKKSSRKLIRNMITRRIVVATTQKWGIVAEATMQAIAIPIRIRDLGHQEDSIYAFVLTMTPHEPKTASAQTLVSPCRDN